MTNVYLIFKYSYYYPAGGMQDASRIFRAEDDDAALDVLRSEPPPSYGQTDLVRLDDLDQDTPTWTVIRSVERDHA